MKQVVLKKGEAVVEEVPAPMVAQGKVLVRVAYSCISIGTETAGMKEGGKSLSRRLIENPENIKAGFKMVREWGLSKALEVAQDMIETGNPTGYSAAGEVVAMGEGITDISVGDRVAAAGAGIANHAEIINVPMNLLVKIPEGLGYSETSTITLGAIALQGIRRASPTLGETFVVTGLGILGQLTAQLLKANGVRVIGLDLDANRIRTALSLGMETGIRPDKEDPVAITLRLTGGHGADGVIVTAATHSSEVISKAFNMCRKKGRVVLVGNVGLDIKRSDIYVKELDFFMSTSYGPGRYDQDYEQKGLDYPIGYVRWTENRNMGEYLRLVSDGSVRIGPLIDREYPIEQAPAAYEELNHGEKKPLVILLRYDLEKQMPLKARVEVTPAGVKKQGRLGIAIVGAGSFARSMHLPNIERLHDLFEVGAVMSRTGTTAKVVASKYGARYATTDFAEILNDPFLDAVLISTRHDLHTPMALEALRAGKHVFLEKPLCTTRGEIEEIKALFEATERPPLLMVGFNRRFSPFMARAREITYNRVNPMIVNYRMNAGFLPLSHWIHTEEGGGRNIGEACHIYDLFNFLTGAEVKSVEATSITPHTAQYGKNDNFVATIKYKDGSICTLTYTALGSKEYLKEEMELYVDGKILKMAGYKRLEVFGARLTGMRSKKAQKGHVEELKAFYKAIKEGKEAIPLWQQLQASELALEVENRITS